ncbi:uncharacterized protein LOC108679886 isoform X2 [Hyalella azteca]|uniref:Uncharacterized protein LOC108679886 isoform X1 n=1 Tax=Hyalella azteca TaxID=294128 RepID=A0A8B7PET4_HYAAZ|nr:uncharacterized protein LOC108679886 isoform X1 [Hyalella azteca]XP_018024117.1 uncharacterized protein LOC108679886 isoform X2 [Hyalella azteca]
MATRGQHVSLWLALTILAMSVFCMVCATDYDEVAEQTDSYIPIKRNVAYWARSGNRKFFFRPRGEDKRNVAWLARTGGRNTALFPAANKRFDGDFDGVGEEIDSFVEPEEDYNVEDDSDPYAMDKRNIASLVNSKTIPSFMQGYKRHIGPALRFRGQSGGKYQTYDRPDKRYLASLLKSENLPQYYARMNRMNYYGDAPSKRFFSSLLENDYGAPGEGYEKRNVASLLKSDSFKGKRPFSSLLKSQSGIGIAGKRSFSSILDDSKSDTKRFVASLLKSSALRDSDLGPSSNVLGSILDRQGNDFDKRSYASLINRYSPYSQGRHITKRHAGSLDDQQFYDVDDANSDADEYEKRSVGSVMKSFSFKTPGKKHIGSALRGKVNKREPNYDQTTSEEENQLDELQKRYLGSLLDTNAHGNLYSSFPGKRHFSSLLGSSRMRSLYQDEPFEENETKRHIGSLLGSRTIEGKRFLGSLKNSETPFLGNSGIKRFLGSAINSRLAFKIGNNGFRGSAIGSRRNFGNGGPGSSWAEEPNHDTEKRFVESIIQSGTDNKNEDKRFYASLVDNSKNTDMGSKSDGSADKRFLGSALNFKSPSAGEMRTKRNASEAENEDEYGNDDHGGRHKRSLEYYDDDDILPISAGINFAPDFEKAGGMDFVGGSEEDMPVKKFLPARLARLNWFPEFYYNGYNM